MEFLPNSKPNYFFNNLIIFWAFFAFLSFRENHGISEIFDFHFYFYHYFKQCLIDLYNAKLNFFSDHIFTIATFVIISLILPILPSSLFVLRVISNVLTLGVALVTEISWLIFIRLSTKTPDYIYKYKNNWQRKNREKSVVKRIADEKNSSFNAREQRLNSLEKQLEERKNALKSWENELTKMANDLMKTKANLEHIYREKLNELILEKKALDVAKNNAQNQLARETERLLNEHI